MVSAKFLTQKTIGKKNHFLKFLVSRNVFKKGEFCQFLVSKNYNKIWHCFNIFCNFCVSEIFGMSPVFVALCSQREYKRKEHSMELTTEKSPGV